MRVIHPTLLAAALLAAPTAALAQPAADRWNTSAVADDFVGDFDLRGEYSTRRHTAADIAITKDASGDLQVTRTGRYTSSRHSWRPHFTWTSDQTYISASRVVRVFYRPPADAGGMVGGVTGGSTAPAQTNTFMAFYRFEHNGHLSELVMNLSRRAPERWWRSIKTSGPRESPNLRFIVAAEQESSRLAELLMKHRVDIDGRYNVGDPDYDADLQDAQDIFQRMVWGVGRVPRDLDVTGHKCLTAVLTNRARDFIGGRFKVLLDFQANVTHAILAVNGTVYYTDDQGEWQVDSPGMPATGTTITCAGGGAAESAVLDEARDRYDDLADFVMNMRSSVFDYYDPGDQAIYEADERAAVEFFRTATVEITPIPGGYSAHRAVKVSNADPTDVVNGTITILFDCNGGISDIVYLHEGEVFDRGHL